MKMFFLIQLYTLQICAASLSLLSSSFIAVGILRSESGLNNPYRRIVFGISASDILQSLSIIAGPFAVPETTPTAQWAIGNHSSCRAIGFLFELSSICTPLYMLGLCLYTVFKVTKNVSNKKFTRQIEKKMHNLIVLSSLCIMVYALATNTIHSGTIGNICLFAAFPTGCRQSPDLFGECDQSIHIHVNILLGMVTFVIPSVCLIGIIVCMSLICWHVFQDSQVKETNASDKKSAKNGYSICINEAVVMRSSHLSSPNMSDRVVLFDDQNEGTKSHEDKGIQLNCVSACSPESRGLNSSGVLRSPLFVQRYRREIMYQSLYFVLGFFVTFIFWWILIFTLMTRRNPSRFLVVSATLFVPLGGFFNVLVYTRPKVKNLLIKHPEWYWIQAMWRVIREGAGDVDALSPRRTIRNFDAIIRSVAFGIGLPAENDDDPSYSVVREDFNSSVHDLSVGCLHGESVNNETTGFVDDRRTNTLESNIGLIDSNDACLIRESPSCDLENEKKSISRNSDLPQKTKDVAMQAAFERAYERIHSLQKKRTHK